MKGNVFAFILAIATGILLIGCTATPKTNSQADQLQDVYTTAAMINNSTSNLGMLTVYSSPPGAKVYVDGAYRGTTSPSIILILTAGTHAVNVTKTGYTPFGSKVNITARKAIRGTAVLKPVNSTATR